MQTFLYFARNCLGQGIARVSASILLAAALAALAGCHGGDDPNPPEEQDGTTTGTPGAPAPAGAPSIALALTNAAGATVSAISTGAPATVKATLKDAAGAVIPNAIVTFSTDATLATISPAATALTNAAGVATITLSPATIVTAGATDVKATAQVGTVAVTGSIGFAVGVAAVTITAPVLGVGAAPLSAFGTTSVAVTVSFGGVPVATPQNVTFASACAGIGKAVLSAGVATVEGGVATGSYRDNGCAGIDVITASAAGVTSPSTSLVVAAPVTGSIQFVSATPSIIALKGIGGTEASQVRFKVLDTGGNPLSGKAVSFGLSTTVGGITLTPAAPATAISDAGGLVVTNVNSGTVSTPVRVTASTAGATAGTTLTTQSSALTITTGIPDQDSISVSATVLNPEFLNFDGNTTVLTVRLADHFNNPVPDGTAVNFTTEGGSIVASCSTTGGLCSSTLTSQAPRLATDGRYTVLVYAVGEESFTDLNGNGVADLEPNELIDQNGAPTDLPEAFRDDNENGVRDATETFLDFNQNGVYDGPDGKYSGVLCDNITPPPAGSSVGTCSARRALHVRKFIPIIFSGSDAVITKIAPAGTITLNKCPTASEQTVDLRVVDVNGNPMPAGTTIKATSTLAELTGISSFTQDSTNVTPPAGAVTHSVSLRAVGGIDCVRAGASGRLQVTVKTPGDVTTIKSFDWQVEP